MASKFTIFFNPVLNALRELGGSAHKQEVIEYIEQTMDPKYLDTSLLKGGDVRYANQIAWARWYLTLPNYIDSGSKRGVWALTDQAPKHPLSDAEIKEIVKMARETRKANNKDNNLEDEDEITVEEVEVAAKTTSHREQLLDIMLNLPPEGFERLCQRLLRESGFEKVTVMGRTGDGGIDGRGIVQVNPFVSFHVYFQCKRYQGSVGSSVIRDFRGAIVGRADKGVILTTGTFTASARAEAERDGGGQIELIDGEKILDMLESLELGVRVKELRKIYEVDANFFKSFN